MCLSLSAAPYRTPLHCAASCNSVHLCKLLVESGAAIFASTISDVETAADKCEEMEEGYIQCSQFLYGEPPVAWGPLKPASVLTVVAHVLQRPSPDTYRKQWCTIHLQASRPGSFQTPFIHIFVCCVLSYNEVL